MSELLSEGQIVRHREQDFDTCTYMSCIFLYVTDVLWRHKCFYPKSPIGIMAHPIQDREEWLVIRSGFHPQDTFDNHIYSNFLNRDLNQIPTPLV